jgi:hypothetical protein
VPGVAVTVATPGTFSCRAVRLVAAMAVAVAAVVATGPGVAYGAWRSDAGAASATASAHAIPPVGAPTATNAANGSHVTVAWPAVAYASGVSVGGYVVRAVDATSGAARAIGAGCNERITATTCDELHAPEGRWRYTVSAVAGDQWSGVPSPPSTTVTVDTTPPANVTLTPLPDAIRSGQQLTSSATDAVTGVASVTYLFCTGASCTPSTPISASATGPTYAVEWTSQPPDGTYRVAVRAVDGAGHTTDSAPQTVTIDNAAPLVAVSAPAPGSSTTARTVSFTGTAGSADGDSTALNVIVFAGSGTGGATVQVLSVARVGSGWSVASAPLSDGTYTVQATQDDAAGNVGVSAPRTFTVDATPPALVAISTTNVATAGKIERGDALRLTFSEPLDPASVPTTGTMTVTNVNNVERLELPGITDGPIPTGSAGYALKNHVAAWSTSISLSAGDTVVTVAITNSGEWAGFGSAAGPVQFAPAPTLKDRAGNAAAGLLPVTLQLF